MGLDMDSYSAEAEDFLSAIDREYYQHFAGHKETYEVAPIYERHAGLFERSALEELRELLSKAEPGDDERRCRYLLQLAAEGFIGEQTKALSTELAERESKLSIEVDGTDVSYRQTSIVQANEPDPNRRLEIEEARNELLEHELNPLYVELMEQAHQLSAGLGWQSYRAMFEELKAVDLAALETQTGAFLRATDSGYREAVEPQLVAETGISFDALRRSDFPYFFRGKTHDSLFPEERLVETLEQTLTGLGIDLRSQSNVTLDLEQRPNKSARAFCSPVHVPNEVYLVISRRGGRDDYAALFHEAGHTEHYANVDPELSFEFRYLGDNSVTEGFAFLLEHLTEDPSWLAFALGDGDADRYLEYVRASKLVFLRRYAAKLTYELELHTGRHPLEEMRKLYGDLLGKALGVRWPGVSYLADVDDGYYVVNYLRAWAFETTLRRILRERFGEDWFTRPAAGDFLRAIWREGQRLSADEMLTDLGEGPLDFAVMLAEVDVPAE
jgi:hypothetical protein